MGEMIAKMEKYCLGECDKFGLEYRPIKRNFEKIINYNFSTYERESFRLLKEEMYWETPGIYSYESIENVMELRKADDRSFKRTWTGIRRFACIDVLGKKGIGFTVSELEFVFSETLDGFAAFLGMVGKSILSEANPDLLEKRKLFEESLGITYDDYVHDVVEKCFLEIEKQLKSEEKEYENWYRQQINQFYEPEKSTLLQVEEETEEEE